MFFSVNIAVESLHFLRRSQEKQLEDFQIIKDKLFGARNGNIGRTDELELKIGTLENIFVLQNVEWKGRMKICQILERFLTYTRSRSQPQDCQEAVLVGLLSEHC